MIQTILIFLGVLVALTILVNKSELVRNMLLITDDDYDMDGTIQAMTVIKKVIIFFVLCVVIDLVIVYFTKWKWLEPYHIVFSFWGLALLGTLVKKQQTPKINKFEEASDSFIFRVQDDLKKIVLNNPFRGVFVSGGAGAGKSKSLIEPIIQQAGAKNYAGIVYDFKFPTLAKEVAGSYAGSKVKPYYINFTDLSRSHLVNPISPEYITNAIFARESAITILTNIDAKAVQKRDFWVQSAESLLTGVIWYLRNNHPEYCTLPHAVSLIIETQPKKLIELLSSDDEVSGIIASLRSAQDSENTLAGMFATVQNYLSVLNTKENFWVLHNSQFSLKLNDPEEPKMLVVGNNDMISKSLSPIIALIISTALKQMNQEGRAKSVVILDEAPTINIPNFAQIPATARSNKIATVYAVQDIAQMEAELGKQESEKILANLNSQFYGRTTNTATAERVSKLFGEYEKEIITRSDSKGKSVEVLGERESSKNRSISTTTQLRKVLEPAEMSRASVGQFACILAESNTTEFIGQFKAEHSKATPIESFLTVTEEKLKNNFKQIKEESKWIIEAPKKEGSI